MSSAWTKIVVARLMIEECDAILAACKADGLNNLTPGFATDTREITAARRAYWGKVESQASLEYSLEGGS